jgi:hypothetical protein
MAALCRQRSRCKEERRVDKCRRGAMTPQIGCCCRNPPGRLRLRPSPRPSSSPTFVASSSLLVWNTNTNVAVHAGSRMGSKPRHRHFSRFAHSQEPGSLEFVSCEQRPEAARSPARRLAALSDETALIASIITFASTVRRQLRTKQERRRCSSVSTLFTGSMRCGVER